MSAGCVGCCYCYGCGLVDCAHAVDFGCYIGGRVLDDAEGVDPEVAESEIAGNLYGVLECARQGGDWDTEFVVW